MVSENVNDSKLRRDRVVFGLVVVVACMILGGCGGAESPVTESSTPRAPAAEAATDANSGDVMSQAARAAGQRFNVLVAVYAPVSRRINFLVAAETLRADAVASGASRATELERSGVVRIEAGKLRRVLRFVRPRVAAVAVLDPAQRAMQLSMLQALDSRSRAVSRLIAALDAISEGAEGDTVTEQRLDDWQASWDESLRAARAATNTMQDARAELGLEPAPEESIR